MAIATILEADRAGRRGCAGSIGLDEVNAPLEDSFVVCMLASIDIVSATGSVGGLTNCQCFLLCSSNVVAVVLEGIGDDRSWCVLVPEIRGL